MKKWICKGISILTALTVMLMSTPFMVFGQSPENQEKIAEDSAIILYADKATGEFSVENKKTGYLWTSNPADRKNDPIAKGTNKVNLSAQMVIQYADSKNESHLVNNVVGSVNKKGLSYQLIDQGIRFEYKFPKEKFTIPVEYVIKDGHFEASIDTKGIIEESEFKIIDISFLPSFGAGGAGQEGHMLVPDGSGALINFNNGKVKAAEYNEYVYGRDPVLYAKQDVTETQRIHLPVFGIKTGDQGLFAIIEDGDAAASIYSDIAGKKTSYNMIYSILNYRVLDTAVLQEMSWNERNVYVLSQSAVGLDRFKLRFYLLDGEASNYGGMAQVNRDYLIEKYQITKKTKTSEAPLFIDFQMSVPKKKSFFGIPFTFIEPLTTYKDVREILQTLHENGVDQVTARLTGWMKGGSFGKIPSKPSIDSKLGGKKQWNSLLEYAKFNQDIRLYPSVDFINMYKTGNGFTSIFDAVRSVNKSVYQQFNYRKNLFDKDYKVRPWYLLTPLKFPQLMDQFMKSFTKLHLNSLSLHSMGNTLYSDYDNGNFGGSKPVDRQGTETVWQQSMGNLKESIQSMMVEDANQYALPYADCVIGAPLYSSRFDIEDEEIPFYQMVLHGLIPYSAASFNLVSDRETHFLRAVESGAFISYTWIGKESSAVKNTRANNIYSGDYRVWMDSAVSQYKQLKELYDRVGDQAMVSHKKISTGIYETRYENGLKTIVNYNDFDVEVEGMKVGARNFVSMGG